MKLSDLQTMQLPNKKFSVSSEKLKANFELVLKTYSSGEDVYPGCDKCTDGRIKVAAEGAFGYKTQECECVKTAKEINDIVAELHAAGIRVEVMMKYPLETFTEGMFSVKEIEQLLNKGKWLYLHGDVGTGKTHAAMICLYLALMSGYSVHYANVPMLLDQLRPQEMQDSTVITDLTEVDFLILDDLGKEKVSSWVLERLYIIINERYTRDKMTVITSESSLEKLQEKVGENRAIVSRIRGSSTDVLFVGKDKR